MAVNFAFILLKIVDSIEERNWNRVTQTRNARKEFIIIEHRFTSNSIVKQ